jgi:S1-C subfamily serine protease
LKKEAQRSTFPFAGDGYITPPPFGGNSPFSAIDRQENARSQLDFLGSHVAIDEGEKKEPHINPMFRGEANDIFNATGVDRQNVVGFAVITDNGRLVFKNRSSDSVLKELKDKKISFRYMTAIFAKSNEKFVKEASDSSKFVPIISSLLASCFKIESESYEKKVKEIGSCFYVKENYAITCAHVISRDKSSDISKISVFLIDGNKKYFCRIIDIDYDLDVALIYCDSVKHSAIQTKSIDEVQVGEEIICVGSPYGYDNNVTTGIVSSKDRNIKDDNVPYFFMDLSVYPGSSGGPVVDSGDSKAFGIAAMIVESVGNYGLNAAIPIDVCAKRFSKILNTRGNA